MSGRVPGVTTTPTMRDVIALSWPLAMNALFLQAILIVDTVLVTPLGEASLAAMGLAASLASVVSGAQWFVNWREENHASAGCSISRFRQGPTPD